MSNKIINLEDHKLIKESGQAIDKIEQMALEADLAGNTEMLDAILKEITPLVESIEKQGLGNPGDN